MKNNRDRTGIIVPFLLLGLFVLTACTKKTQSMSSTPLPQPRGGYSFLALGDSYTIGEGVTEKERFPFLTAELLQKENIGITELRYIATTGWSTIALQSAIQQQQFTKSYDIVTLLIGVNDQYQRLDTAGYRQRFGQLLFRAIELAGNRKGRVFVLSIPDYSFTPFVSEPQKERVRTEIDAFNRINKEITLGQGVQYVEITSSTREAINDPGLLASDKLHYSGKEHLRWAALLVPVIKDALKE